MRARDPESGVGFVEGEATSQASWSRQTTCASAGVRFGMDEFDALIERQGRSHDGHAAGVAHVHSDAVSMLAFAVLLPIHLEADLPK